MAKTQMTTTPDSKGGRLERWIPALSLFVIITVGLLSYVNTFNAAFVFDDITNIVDNPYIMVSDVTSRSMANILKSRSKNRPLANATLAMNYFFHQHRVFGYHAVNLLIHLLTAIMVYLIAQRTIRRLNIKASLLPLGAAILWMTNPVQTQAVTYVVQRMTALAAFFYLLSLYAYIRARQHQSIHADHGQAPLRWYMICTTAMLFGFVSKEITVLLPVFLFLYEWYFIQNLNGQWIKQKSGWIVPGLIICVAAAIVYTRGDPVGKLLSTYEYKPFTPLQRLLTEPEVIIYYISLLGFPHPGRLNLDYNFPVSSSVSDPVTALALTALAGLSLLAVYSARRHRLLSFAILWFIGNLLLESTLLGLDIIYEHRLYLPSVVPAIAIAVGLQRFCASRKTTAIIILILVITGGLWTFQRNTVWHTNIGLWLDNAAKAPTNPRAFNQLGLVCARTGQDFHQAARHLETALKLSRRRWGKNHPMTAIHHYNLGEVYRMAQDWASAEYQYRRAMAVVDQSGGLRQPAMAAIYNSLAATQKAKGDIEGAITEYNKALAALPPRATKDGDILNAAGIQNNLGVAYAEKKDYDMAQNHFEKALAITQEAFGSGHPRTLRAAQTLRDLAIIRQQAVKSDREDFHTHPGPDL